MNSITNAKKEYKVVGTLRQRRAIAIWGENGGNMSAAMRAAGYSTVSAHHPEKLTNSRAFKELTHDYLPDIELVKIHRGGLYANRLVTFHFGGKNNRKEFEVVPDWSTRHKYLVLALRVKGYL